MTQSLPRPKIRRHALARHENEIVLFVATPAGKHRKIKGTSHELWENGTVYLPVAEFTEMRCTIGLKVEPIAVDHLWVDHQCYLNNLFPALFDNGTKYAVGRCDRYLRGNGTTDFDISPVSIRDQADSLLISYFTYQLISLSRARNYDGKGRLWDARHDRIDHCQRLLAQYDEPTPLTNFVTQQLQRAIATVTRLERQRDRHQLKQQNHKGFAKCISAKG